MSETGGAQHVRLTDRSAAEKLKPFIPGYHAKRDGAAKREQVLKEPTLFDRYLEFFRLVQGRDFTLAKDSHLMIAKNDHAKKQFELILGK